MGVSQEDLAKFLWVPPLGWEVGYFFWGWVSDRFATEKDRPLGLYVLLTVLALPLGAVTWMPTPVTAVLVFF